MAVQWVTVLRVVPLASLTGCLPFNSPARNLTCAETSAPCLLVSPAQTLLVLLKKQPPEGRKLFVVGTTSLGLVMQVRLCCLHLPCCVRMRLSML